MNKVLMVLAAVVILAVGGWVVYEKNNQADTSDSNVTPTSSRNSATESNTTDQNVDKVSIENMLFTPAQITIKKGTKVTWTNNDDEAHTVTSDTDGLFDSGTVEAGGSYSTTFNNTGSFPYHCNFHSEMHGTVVVQ